MEDVHEIWKVLDLNPSVVAGLTKLHLEIGRVARAVQMGKLT
jgi:hypothetical protein